MALSNAEKVRRYRERLKQGEQEKDKVLIDDVFQRPFYQHYEQRRGEDLDRYFDMMGLQVPEMEDDRDPFSLTGWVEEGLNSGEGYHGFAGYKRSLGRAEVIMNALQLAAAELGSIIVEYKREEINARISEVENADLSAPDVKTKALADIVRLRKMLDQLDSKQVKWTLPQWRVTGE